MTFESISQSSFVAYRISMSVKLFGSPFQLYNLGCRQLFYQPEKLFVFNINLKFYGRNLINVKITKFMQQGIRVRRLGLSITERPLQYPNFSNLQTSIVLYY